MEWFQNKRNQYTHNYLILFARNVLCFAASNFDTTSELTLQIFCGVQQNLHTMKQITINSNNTMNKKASQKQIMKNKKAEANARRKVNKSWEKVEHSPRYRSASVKYVCDTITRKIEIEVMIVSFPISASRVRRSHRAFRIAY